MIQNLAANQENHSLPEKKVQFQLGLQITFLIEKNVFKDLIKVIKISNKNFREDKEKFSIRQELKPTKMTERTTSSTLRNQKRRKMWWKSTGVPIIGL